MRYLVPLLLLALPQFAHAQDSVTPSGKYAEAIKYLDAFIAAQVKQHGLPALSIALVDGDDVVWAKGYGYADPQAKTAATAQTVYRVGSVSKLFTDLAVLQLVEQGKIDLDADVRKYLPDFDPKNDSGKAITLRMLVAHRSGLVREPPVGSYFHGDQPSLAKTVESLNGIPLIHKPEEKLKYSNAGIAVVGRVLEKVRGKAFAECVRETLLEPMGMKEASFEQTPAVKKRLAKAIMWTYHGREFPAPTFDLGEAPAGNAYCSVMDLSKFLTVLFNKGQTPDGKRIIKPETLKEAYRKQYAKDEKAPEFGLGFHVRDLDGKLRVGHGGAVYGFATDLSALPDDKLGVVVAASCDVANAVTGRIATLALETMLAVKQKKTPPRREPTTPLDPKEARELVGRYEGKAGAFDLYERGGRLHYLNAKGGFRMEVRKQSKHYLIDDRHAYGLKIERDGKSLKLDGKDVYERVEAKKPAECKASHRGLIGEYGFDHIKLIILERDGKLNALIEWVFLDPLEEVSEDVFRFPKDQGLYPGETLVFTRDKSGKATKVVAAGVEMQRRRIPGEDGGTFTIEPLRPVEELRKLAMKATPPAEEGLFRKPELVELVKLDKTIKLDVRYATKNNFLKTPFYRSAKAYLQKPAAEALVRVHEKLKDQGYGLLIHDGYRPWSVTKMFYDATPADLKLFVADPEKGSRHNRGCAVDLTLYDRESGRAVEMTGGYDEMSDRSYPDYPGGTSLQRWHWDVLRRAMEAEGYDVYEAEWWHFDYRDWRKYPIGNQTFEELK